MLLVETARKSGLGQGAGGDVEGQQGGRGQQLNALEGGVDTGRRFDRQGSEYHYPTGMIYKE
ncbi:hypothetical protein AB5J49_00235 [Streptomyces sp. R28]|uniref:Uncharacterized protein n=1 Tax=Streptomyces sp. R28 TaxID=3238628 RepID=A0AB39PMX9_9ACTN